MRPASDVVRISPVAKSSNQSVPADAAASSRSSRKRRAYSSNSRNSWFRSGRIPAVFASSAVVARLRNASARRAERDGNQIAGNLASVTTARRAAPRGPFEAPLAAFRPLRGSAIGQGEWQLATSIFFCTSGRPALWPDPHMCASGKRPEGRALSLGARATSRVRLFGSDNSGHFGGHSGVRIASDNKLSRK